MRFRHWRNKVILACRPAERAAGYLVDTLQHRCNVGGADRPEVFRFRGLRNALQQFVICIFGKRDTEDANPLFDRIFRQPLPQPARLFQVALRIAGIDDAIGHQHDRLVGIIASIQAQLVQRPFDRRRSVGPLAIEADTVQLAENLAAVVETHRRQRLQQHGLAVEHDNRHPGILVLRANIVGNCGNAQPGRVIQSHAAGIIQDDHDISFGRSHSCSEAQSDT